LESGSIRILEADPLALDPNILGAGNMDYLGNNEDGADPLGGAEIPETEIAHPLAAIKTEKGEVFVHEGVGGNEFGTSNQPYDNNQMDDG